MSYKRYSEDIKNFNKTFKKVLLRDVPFMIKAITNCIPEKIDIQVYGWAIDSNHDLEIFASYIVE